MGARITIAEGLGRFVDELEQRRRTEPARVLRTVGERLVRDAKADWYTRVKRRTGRSGDGPWTVEVDTTGTRTRLIVRNGTPYAQDVHAKGDRDSLFGELVIRPGIVASRQAAEDIARAIGGQRG